VVLGQNPGPFTGPGTNTYLIGTGKRPLLLDTGHGIPEYVPLLERALTDRLHRDGIQEIVLSHGHPDHVGGVSGIRERFGPLRASKMRWPERDGDLDFDAVEEGVVFETDGATLRSAWTPGHARDHLCFFFEEERALFTGDMVLGAGTTVIPLDGDLGDYLTSLRRLLTFDAEIIYPAHGPRITRPREKIQAYLDHRALRDRQILEQLGEGARTVEEIVEKIYVDVPQFLHGAARLSVHAHLRKLEKEDLVEHEADHWSLR